MAEPTWTISALAQEFSITPRTIRFYEDQGIVSPQREGRNRVYTARDRTRLKLALRGKRLGLQLSEIVSLINMYDAPTDTQAQLRHYLDVLGQHRAQLLRQRQDIDLTLKEIDEQETISRGLLARKQAGTGRKAATPEAAPQPADAGRGRSAKGRASKGLQT
ncbi:MerR family transcriptional regulator [Pusillimonas sp. TS35]|uniref:MerR family transcriptional regulator n=1 Tax=Paracandidimonas lactea TaxID=2895524 RepID=UPI0013681C23|nr:MerR family DNA-binding transcriptional regulator [Paracandidimonas lactea]MYN12485.1 MerR family transcriptional regulator [Pusillimonas sp. TS35]